MARARGKRQYGDQRRGSAPSRPRDGDTPSGSSGSFFEFKDRSGKVHRISSRPQSASQDRTASSAPAANGRPKVLGRPSVERDRPKHSSLGPHKRGWTQPERDPAPTPEISRPRNPKNYGPQEPLVRLRGVIDKNKKGFGFISFDNRRVEDAFVPPREADQFFHGDRVEVAVNTDGEIQDLKVIEHRFREIVGRYQPEPRRGGGHLIYERKNVREEVLVPGGYPGAKAGDWVKAEMLYDTKGSSGPVAKVLEVYGDELPSHADIGMVAAEHNLIEEHSAEAVAQAEGYRLDAENEIHAGRIDLRDLPLITIDGETARDFDDAVYVERDRDGYTLWVAIADVSHYVTEDSPLDREALSRGTSVYFPERAFHMLPRALSENLCSLVPHQPRLALVSKIRFDKEGKRQGVEVMEAVMRSKRRATYNEIQAEWEENQQNASWEFRAHFELYRALRKSRNRRGSIDFDLPEAEIRVDAAGFPLSIRERPRLEAHRLIEEFMIAANEAVTSWMMEREWPFIYRVHDEPSEVALERFRKMALNLGVPFSYESGSLHLVIPELIQRLEGHPAQDLLNMALLRSMKQAMYSAEFGRHFGLASVGYTHFTSPIRRYPDLVVHRLIRHALRVAAGREPPLNTLSRDQLQEKLAEIAEHCSYRERIASDCERESIRLKQIRIMLKHLGDEFEGKVNGMNDNGLFVKIPEPFVEGFIPKDSMTDDSYEFNAERMIFYGRRKKRTFKVGQPIRVRVDRADLDRRLLDFALVGAGDAPEPKRTDLRHKKREKSAHRKSDRKRRT